MINYDSIVGKLSNNLNELKSLIISLIEENKRLNDENKKLKLDIKFLKEKYSDLDY